MPVVDNQIAKTGDDAYRLYFMLRQDGMGYAQVTNKREVLRPTDHVGDLIRHNVKYGAARSHDNKVITCQVDDA